MPQFAVTNPATGESLYTVTAASAAQCQATMASARAAAEALRDIPLSVRLKAVDAVLAYLRQHRERLLDQIVAESGRSRGDAMLSDLFQLTEDCLWLRHNAARLLADETVPTPISLLGKRSRILYEPRGVVLVISPGTCRWPLALRRPCSHWWRATPWCSSPRSTPLCVMCWRRYGRCIRSCHRPCTWYTATGRSGRR